jgi:hypothetical protein
MFATAANQIDWKVPMQNPFASSPVNKNAQDASLYNWEIVIIAFVAAVMLFMISFALVTQYRGGDSDADGSVSLAREFSLAMPLP